MTQKPPPRPAWWKNTYFWIGAILFVVGVIGLPFIGGDHAVRDPGQKHESHLWLLYFAGSALMLLNGYMSHRQTVQHYQESLEEKE